MYIVLDLADKDSAGLPDGHLKLQDSGDKGQFIEVWFGSASRKAGKVSAQELLRAVTALVQEEKKKVVWKLI